MGRRPVSILALALIVAGGVVAAPGCSGGAPPEDALADNATAATSTGVTPALEQAAFENLKRLSAEVDTAHLSNYEKLPARSAADFQDRVARAFINALKTEYATQPAMLERRMQAIASIVLISDPGFKPNATFGRITPFHGMDRTAFESLGFNEDFIFGEHVRANKGSPNGVRPFSVCETTYLIEIAKGKVTAPWIVKRQIQSGSAYATAFAQFAKSCARNDLDEWYNFRGLGALRPSWLESNYNDRVLRSALDDCEESAASPSARCNAFRQDRTAFRNQHNTAMALRQMVYDPAPTSQISGSQDGAYLASPRNAVVFLEDQNGDNVAEMIPEGAAKLAAGAKLKLAADSLSPSAPSSGATSATVLPDGRSLQMPDGSVKTLKASFTVIVKRTAFAGTLGIRLTLDDGSTLEATAGPGAVEAISRVDARWKPEFAQRNDFGLTELFADPTGCRGAVTQSSTCPLKKRLMTMIDRHEDFYRTYSSFNPDSPSLGSQPSPLVACSVTLRAAQGWSTAGQPKGGNAGLIFLTRIPFSDIISGDSRSIDTLGRLKGSLTAGPKVTTLEAIAAGQSKLDMTKGWLDIATLSNNKFASEHEISKFGSVPAEQIETILVLDVPGALLPGASTATPSPEGGT